MRRTQRCSLEDESVGTTRHPGTVANTTSAAGPAAGASIEGDSYTEVGLGLRWCGVWSRFCTAKSNFIEFNSRRECWAKHSTGTPLAEWMALAFDPVKRSETIWYRSGMGLARWICGILSLLCQTSTTRSKGQAVQRVVSPVSVLVGGLFICWQSKYASSCTDFAVGRLGGLCLCLPERLTVYGFIWLYWPWTQQQPGKVHASALGNLHDKVRSFLEGETLHLLRLGKLSGPEREADQLHRWTQGILDWTKSIALEIFNRRLKSCKIQIQSIFQVAEEMKFNRNSSEMLLKFNRNFNRKFNCKKVFF